MSLYTPERLESGAFLDICAGSGLVGFEGLSRGAQHVYFVEVDAQTTQALKENAAHFGVAELVTVLRVDARRSAPRIAKATQEHGRISCAFIDAPYIPGMAQDLLDRFAGALGGDEFRAAFSEDALLIARTPDKLNPELPNLELSEHREAGGRDKLWLWGIPALSS